MLPSWISRYVSARAGSKSAIGIAVGRQSVCALHTQNSDKGELIQSLETVNLSEPLFTAPPTAAASAALSEAFVRVASYAKDNFIPCHVALPDPVGTLSVFALDECPNSDKTRRELVQWRFSKEFAVAADTMEYVHQGLGVENGKHLLLGQGVERLWLQCIKQALRSAAITPWSINVAACYRFNQFHEQFARTRDGAALVMLDSDCWSVVLWDAAARPRLLRSHWRNKNRTSEDYDSITLEVERLILSYVRSAQSTVGRVYALSHARELEAITTALDRRLREKSHPLLTRDSESIDKKITNHPLGLLALAAAA